MCDIGVGYTRFNFVLYKKIILKYLTFYLTHCKHGNGDYRAVATIVPKPCEMFVFAKENILF